MDSSEEYFMSLDPKARFQPTDQELIKHFLKRRLSGDPLPMNVIIDEQLLYNYSPVQLSHMYGFENQKEMYFFTPGVGPICVQELKSCDGCWKPITTYQLIKEGNKTIGFKKLLRFYEGSSKKDATLTNWTMVRYASECFGTTVGGSFIFLCKVYEQKTNAENIPDLKLNTPGKSAADVTRDQPLLGSYITRPLQELYQSEMRRCLTKNSSQLSPAISCTSSYLKPCLPHLPFEIIGEILSWLPVKCLLRFMCVCKNWCLLIEDYKFISKHMGRVSLAPMYFVYRWKIDGLAAMYDTNFTLISSFCGLVLEKSLDSRVFRIRNAARRQLLFLPYAHEGTTSTMDFAFNSITGDCKVACFYCKTEGMGNSISHEVGFKVISIGKDEEWRPLKLPNQNDKLVLRQGGKYVLKRHSFGPDKVHGFAHLVEIIRDGQNLSLEIQSFDVWSECFITSTLRRGVFLDLQKVSVIRWYHYLAVADIADAALHVLLLEDPRVHRWSKKKIIVPLNFLKDDPALEAKIIPKIACKDTVVLHEFDNGRARKILHKYSRVSIPQVKHYIAFKPSLVTLKGMKLKRIMGKIEGESNQ